MSTKAQIKTQAKTPAAPAAARIPQPPVAGPEHEVERPDIAAQLEGTARLGHSLGAVGVASSAPPTIQRQEIPEEEEEELQLKREPATVQRQELPEEEEEKEELQMKPETAALQRQSGGEGFQLDDETAGRINRARGGGQPLAGETNKYMSAAMSYDFSKVRVHTDAEADQLNQQLQAKAFTTGPDIFFKRGAYAPASGSGRELIAHELSHVVQQGTGRVRGGGRGMTVRPAGDAFEQEAEAASKTVYLDGLQAPKQDAAGEGARPVEIGSVQHTIGYDDVQTLMAQQHPEDVKVSGEHIGLGAPIVQRTLEEAQLEAKKQQITKPITDRTSLVEVLRTCGKPQAAGTGVDLIRIAWNVGILDQAVRVTFDEIWPEEEVVFPGKDLIGPFVKSLEVDKDSLVSGRWWEIKKYIEENGGIRKGSGLALMYKFLIYAEDAEEIVKFARDHAQAYNFVWELQRQLSAMMGGHAVADNMFSPMEGDEDLEMLNTLEGIFVGNLEEGKQNVEKSLSAGVDVARICDHYFLHDKGYMNAREIFKAH